MSRRTANQNDIYSRITNQIIADLEQGVKPKIHTLYQAAITSTVLDISSQKKPFMRTHFLKSGLIESYKTRKESAMSNISEYEILWNEITISIIHTQKWY